VSKTRLAVRLFLFLILLGMLVLAGFAWINNQPDALWDRAQAAIQAGDYDSAKLHLRNLLQKEPNRAEAHLAMANVLLEERKKDHPDATFANVGGAVDHLARAAELRPKDPEILRPLLTAYGRMGREREALKTAELLEQADRDNADALYWLARDALIHKNEKAAAPLLERLRSLKGEPRLRTLGLLATFYADAKQPRKRDAVLAESLAVAGRLRGKVSPLDLAVVDPLHVAAVKAAPTAAEADRRISLALDFQDRRSKVAKRPVPAAEAAGNLVEAYFAAHPVKANDAKREQVRKAVLARAIALINLAVKSDAAKPELQFQLVRLIMLSGDSVKAVTTAEAALNRLETSKTRDADVELNLHLIAAEASFRQAKLQSALKHAEALVNRGRKESQLAAGHLLAANIHAAEGRHETAVFHFQKAATNGLGQSLRVHFGLANSYAALGRWQEARSHLEAVNVKPGDVTGPDAAWAKAVLGDGSRVRLRLARTYLVTGEAELAERILDGFLGTEHEPAALALRIVHAWQSDRRLARKRMDAARAKFPTNLSLAYLDIRMHLAVNQPRQAEQIAFELARKRPRELPAQMLKYSILLRQRDYPAALKLLDDLIKRFPKNPALLLAKAQALLDAGKHEQASEAARQLAKYPDWKRAAEYVGALAALRSQNLEDAANRLESLQRGQRRFGSIDLLKGNLNLSQGNPEEAIRELTSALQYSRLQAVAGRSLLRSLLLLANEKSPREALAKVDGLLKQHPTQASLLLAKAELQSRVGDFSGALTTLKALDSVHSNSADGAYYQARFWVSMNQLANARREIERAVRIAPQSTRSRYLAATIAFRENRLEDAIEQLDAGLGDDPKNADFLLLKATVRKQQKKPDEAAELVRQLTTESPDQIPAWMLLAGIHAAENRPEQALATLAEARKKNPGAFQLVRETIHYLASQKKLDEADKLAASLAADKPGFQTLSRMTQAFEAAGETARARQWAEKALAAARTAKEKSQIDAAELKLANLALVESNKPGADAKWLDEARSRFAAIVKRNPRHLVAANNLAWLLAARLNDPTQARKVIDPIVRGHRMDRLPADVLDTIMVVYERQRDFVALEKLLKEAMRVQPGNPRWIRAYVDLAIRRNRLDVAIAELEELHRRRGWWAEPSLGLARIYSAMGRPRDAQAALRRALTIAPSHREARQLAVDVAARLGDPQLVLRAADAALALSPDLWTVHVRKAAALKSLKRSDEAARFLDAGISRLRAALKQSALVPKLQLGNEPQAADYAALAGLLQERHGDDDALDALRDGLKKLPGEIALVQPALSLLLKAGRTADAAALVEKHVAKDAPVSQLLEIALAYYRGGDYGAALDWSGKALARARDEEKPDALLLSADARLAKGLKTKDKALLEQAKADYEAVLKRLPKHLAAGNNLAWLLVAELDRPAEALQVAEQIRGDAPVERMSRSFIDTLSLVYRRTKEWKKARELLQRATATFETHAPFHLQLGEVYIATRDLQAAHRTLQHALSLGLSKSDAARARELLLEVESESGRRNAESGKKKAVSVP
jgi:tetratricopeptide (TPR) repeat protein